MRCLSLALVLTLVATFYPQKPALADDPTPTPTSTIVPPAPDIIGVEYVEMFRIVNSFDCGGSAHDCMRNESDALVMTRIAMGEAPNSINDRIYIMWIIRLRAELGFKDAGYYSGNREIEGRWGPPTSIKEEALCNGGCQFSPARVAENVYFACELPEGSNIRVMLCPADDQLPAFLITYQAAEYILAADLSDFPDELRGYDGFRSPSVSWNGRIDWLGGLPSRQMFRRGNIWRDEYSRDNDFWRNLDEERVFTPTPIPTHTPAAVVLLPEKKYATLTDAEVRESQEEIEMTEIDPGLAAGIVAALSVIVWFLTFVWSGLLKKPKPSENILKVAVVIGAVALAYVYAPVELPVYAGDPLGFGVAFVMVVTTIVKAAQLFYDFIWSKLLGLLDKGIAFAIGRSTASYSLLLPHRS